MENVATQTKTALRRLAKSVAVITTHWQGKRYAMAATAVEGLSLDPPSMLVCIARTASLAPPIQAGARFAINLLASRHQDISAQCVAPWQGEERFALGQWDDTLGEPPILLDAQASFRCTPDLVTDYGTHLIVVGKVDSVQVADDIDPLVYADGRYHGVPSVLGSAAP